MLRHHSLALALLGFALGFALPAGRAFGQLTISLASTTANPGAAVTVPLSLATTGPLASGLQWTMSYPPGQITGISVSAGPSAPNKVVQCVPGTGYASCLLVGMNNSSINTGAAAWVTFTMAPAATTTTVAVTGPVAVAPNGSALSVAGAGAQLTVPGISSLSCAPTVLGAGATSNCTIALTTPAAPGGSAVALYSNNGLLTVPGYVTVPAGASSVVISATAPSVSGV